MPATRRSARTKAASTSSGGLSTADASPVFSARTSVADTPLTTDVEDDELTLKAISKPVRKGKRKVQSHEETEEEEDAPRTTKRRNLSNHAYIEIPVTNTVKKGKAKATATAKASPAAAVSRSRRAAQPVDAGSELEYDEEPSAAEIDDDDSSGSEFQEDDDSDIEEEEKLMLNAAIEESLASHPNTSSSSAARGSTSTRAAAKASGSRRPEKAHVELDSEDDDLSATDSEDEPLTKRANSKGKGKGKAKAKPRDLSPSSTSEPEPEQGHLSSYQRQRKARRATAEARKLNKKEEMALRKKLGRKLTHAERTTIALYKHHPELEDVWGDLEQTPKPATTQKAPQPTNVKLTLLPFQLEGVHWMRQQEKSEWRGGMLADEMGMGKTIQIISLLMSDEQKPSLVVAPTVALMQWKNEIAAHTDGVKVLVWHGHGRETNIKELKKYDVILTTYSVLESTFRKQIYGFKRQGSLVKESSAIHQINFHRIILDEAHNIKERSCNTAKAAFELKANYRWCLSGTPLQNRVGELYSLVRFLGGDPFSYYFCKSCDCKSLHWRFKDKKACDDCGHTPMHHVCLWNNEILTPIQKHGMDGPGKPAFKKLKILLDKMMLRRTKLQRADDLGLPPRTVIVKRDYFSPEEKELYLSLFSDAKRTFSTYLDQGTVLNNYSNIFSLLTRMRQMACHPDLVIRGKANGNQFLNPEDTGEATVCRICNDIAEDAIESKCHHIFDRECIKQYLDVAIQDEPTCPVCHIPLTIDLDAPALELENNAPEARSAKQGILGRLNLDNWRSSSKIEALVEELSNLRDGEPATTKAIVFSQFVNFLDLIAFRLQRAGFTICRLEGTMSPQARDATIKHFMNNVEVTVFLVSLKAGGVALNLTEASRVYLMDSWWNPAVEFQAMDRIHRLGQHRPVKAIKLVVEDSIESRIVQLQDKKSAMVDATLSPDEAAMGRLTPEDLGFLFRL